MINAATIHIQGITNLYLIIAPESCKPLLFEQVTIFKTAFPRLIADSYHLLKMVYRDTIS